MNRYYIYKYMTNRGDNLLKFKIKLDDIDISRIISEYYNVPISNVNLEINETTSGYGWQEHTEYSIECTVDISYPQNVDEYK